MSWAAIGSALVGFLTGLALGVALVGVLDAAARRSKGDKR